MRKIGAFLSKNKDYEKIKSSEKAKKSSSSSSSEEQKSESLSEIVKRPSTRRTPGTRIEEFRRNPSNVKWDRKLADSHPKSEVQPYHPPLIPLSPRLSDNDRLVALEDLVGNPGTDISAEELLMISHLEKTGEGSLLLETTEPPKVKNLPKSPRFGGLISRRVKTPKTPIPPENRNKALYERFDLDSIEAPIEKKSLWTQGPVTMDNLEQAFSETKHAGYSTEMRLLNLIYCALGGKNSINKQVLCPETDGFAQSLTSLKDEDRPAQVNSLLEKFGHHLGPYARQLIGGQPMQLIGGQPISALKKICAKLIWVQDDPTASD